MAEPTPDFLQDYQRLTRQSWDAWTRRLQQAAAPADVFSPGATATSAASETLERTLDGLKGYLEWMQGTTATAPSPASDWQQQLQQWFGGGNQPFAHAFAGINSAGSHSFAQQWQTWLQAAQQSGMGTGAAPAAPTPAFGMDREQQMQQQALAQAGLAAMQASARYQTLLQRAATQGMQRLQDKLALHAEPGRQIDSLKSLYDLWVDASEEAYAEIALTDEFRSAYGEMVNTQMRVRQFQQKYTEALCRQLGMPTRGEVSSLGERLQSLRRELRKGHAASDENHVTQIAALQRALAAMQRQLAAQTTRKPGAKASTANAATPARKPVRAPARKPAASAVRKVAAKPKSQGPRTPATRKAAAKTSSRTPAPAPKPRAASTARGQPRKRK